MHVDRQRRGLERSGVLARLGRLPALRVAEENLHDLSAFGLRCGQWVLRTDM